ncbi:glycosyltransferase [Flavobacterium sp. FlaQc-48]|uniref:glycosyltransferase n=1 Tax=Flavobacterium sp. FlaQc-48 TaxID=3374181 RepID=UPI00375787DB
MVLIDALHINTGGGKAMLDYLVYKLEEQDIKYYYLFDHRIKNNTYKIKPSNEVVYLKASLWNRFFFYLTNRKKFKSIFCLANIPPSLKIKCNVITYFHSVQYFSLTENDSSILKFMFALKSLFLKKSINNSSLWLVQTDLVKQGLSSKFKIGIDKILVMPFYPPFEEFKNIDKKEPFTYLYVSLANPHKNHKRLIESFCTFYDKYKKGRLILTVGKEFIDVLNLIDEKLKSKYPIENLGYIKRNDLLQYYQSSDYLIFPSLTESFGLGLVEAIENGCKIMGADLPYTYAVCKPSIVFDPYSSSSILKAFEHSLEKNIPESTSIISDKIDEVIDMISKH